MLINFKDFVNLNEMAKWHSGLKKASSSYKQNAPKGTIWYHGTSQKNYEKMKETGEVRPFEAVTRSGFDNGKGIWTTSDPNQANMWGKGHGKKTVILSIPNKKLRALNKKQTTAWGREDKTGSTVIASSIPLHHWSIYNPETGEHTPHILPKTPF